MVRIDFFFMLVEWGYGMSQLNVAA